VIDLEILFRSIAKTYIFLAINELSQVFELPLVRSNNAGIFLRGHLKYAHQAITLLLCSTLYRVLETMIEQKVKGFLLLFPTFFFVHN